jgi:LmbE family N-acetylglucosaminyl deacetylase
MLRLVPGVPAGQPLRLLCIGAHSDDLEIGCGGTVIEWLGSTPAIEVTWVVLSAALARGAEARSSANALLRRAVRRHLVIGEFRDGFLPSQYGDVKTFFEKLKLLSQPDIVLTHCLEDRHQDHRLVAELTWNTWRNHLILEYEIPKYEGDLGQPNAYVPVSERHAGRKVAHLDRYFATQRGRDWFRADNFLALMRVRGMECRAESGLAEAFHARKVVI